MSRVLRFLLGLVTSILGLRHRLRPRPRPPRIDPSEREVGAAEGATRLVTALLVLAGLAGVAFCVLYAANPDTQLLGLTFGLALACIAGALCVAAARVFPRETKVEERPQLEHPEEQEKLVEEFERGGAGVSRRRLLGGAAGLAGAGLAAAVAVPIASLGPNVDELIVNTPWRRGRLLVDEHGVPLKADDLEIGQFATAYPQGADIRELGSPVVVVRVRPDQLRLPAQRAAWAPEGLLAFSKICTHAGCAVALFRSPLYQPTSKSPALVCPCHYSTFNVLDGGSVEFGPAGRPLPQLPLMIRPDRSLAAAGGYSGPIGPSWWSVRRPHPFRS